MDRAGETGGVEEAGVVEFVGNDEVVFAGEGGQDGEVGHETGGEEECGFGFLEACEGGFQFVMDGQRAGDEAGKRRCLRPSGRWRLVRRR